MDRRPLLPLLVVAAVAALAGTPASAAPLPPSGTLDLAAVPATSAVTWKARASGSLAGAAVAGAGDFNGDGKADIAVGEPRGDGATRPDSGLVHVLLSAAAGGALEDPATTVLIRGAAAGDRAGTAVAPAGDVDHDGFADLLVGAPAAGSSGAADAPAGGGEAYVVFGRADRAPIDLATDPRVLRITGAEPGARLGASVSAIGDLDGDGRPELVVGAPSRDLPDRANAGSAYVVFGRGEAGTADVSRLEQDATGWRIDGPVGSAGGGALAGRSVAAIGDLNGDGRPEVLLTAPRAGTGPASTARAKGRAYVVYGRPAPGSVDLQALGAGGFTITGKVTADGAPGLTTKTGDWLGESIAPVGDVNRDGLPDLAVGAHLADAPDRPDTGLAYVVFGRRGGRDVDLGALGDGGYTITGVGQQDQTGFSVASAGDFNADGVGDIVVGGVLADPLSRVDAGAAYVVFGAKDGKPEDLDLAELGSRGERIAGATVQGALGFAVAGVGDVDGDGGSDLVIGGTAIDRDYLYNQRADQPGRAVVVFGAVDRFGEIPGEDQRSDPGYAEAVKAGCRPALNVQIAVEDNEYTDEDADPDRIRLAGLQDYVATPRNQDTVLGVSGSPVAGETAAEAVVLTPTLLEPAKIASLRRELADHIDGEDEFPGYEDIFRTLANDNPAADARIMIVDGYTFEQVADAEGLTDGSAPTYVVAIGHPPDRTRADIRQMKRVATETHGRFYGARTAAELGRALQAIESRLRCDVDVDTYTADIDEDQVEEVADTEVEDDAYSADIDVSWSDPGDDFELEEVDVLRQGVVVRRIGRRTIAKAYGVTTTRTDALRAGRGRRFRALHVTGLKRGLRLKVRVRAEEVRRDGRLRTRVTQSRRRR